MREVIIDNFAGGGGASCGIEMAGFHVDAACNHDAAAVAMHIANHPHTRHYTKSLNAIDPLEVTLGQPVGLAELFTAQGFPSRYVLDPIFNGKPLIKTLQVKCCGNSVCPPLAAALVRANVTLRDVEPVAPVYDDFPLFAEVA